MSACFNDTWLVCGIEGKLVENDICRFGCAPEGSYANVDCVKYAAIKFPTAVVSGTETTLSWSDTVYTNHSWVLIRTATYTSPCGGLAGYHLASLDELSLLRDLKNQLGDLQSWGNQLSGFTWFQLILGGVALANVVTSTPGPQLGTYAGLQFPGATLLAGTPLEAYQSGGFWLCMK